MKRKKGFSYGCYRVIRFLIWLFYPKVRTFGLENLPEEPCVICCNHVHFHGPICCELHLPGDHDTWCASEMMELKKVPPYAMDDFWRDKPRWSLWFYHILSWIIAPLAACVFKNARTIPVYRDGGIITTYRMTQEALTSGRSVVIMPEGREPRNHIVYDFQKGFVDVARVYRRKTGKDLCFVPMYIAPALRSMHIGVPTYFDSSRPPAEEKERVRTWLMDEITRVAEELPLHRVVPYPNLPKKDYPKNKPER